MFCTSVRSGKTRACWNVRVSPRRARETGLGLRTFEPAKRIAPASARM